MTVANATETQVLPSSLQPDADRHDGSRCHGQGRTLACAPSTATATLLTGKFNRKPILDFAKQNSIYRSNHDREYSLDTSAGRVRSPQQPRSVVKK